MSDMKWCALTEVEWRGKKYQAKVVGFEGEPAAEEFAAAVKAAPEMLALLRALHDADEVSRTVKVVGPDGSAMYVLHAVSDLLARIDGEPTT